jgi:hypothetical protein
MTNLGGVLIKKKIGTQIRTDEDLSLARWLI